ncbi:FMN-binding negative transcriptional regulator [Sphingomonas sp. HITSZ_GF]|uniref:FMN-binding negative transcriptional regulator n=1 Tax=Sphingomonas sp. HITSZ_GF TaxID=3037247 RepID=UPI00240D9C62|nr:FMN-binding negative transcriptional regulator [Sphingomonas sp. HITSZ_GF]MDG2535935.1 FMN-binding negative transcriptional regulator [Sphingomonas sp. HITSZ_GF]
MADTPKPAAPALYRPDAYAALAPERIVDDYPFATLLSPDLHATATPILFERDDRTTLIGHLARRGSHAQAMQTGDRVLAIFAGPHAYISPRWYAEKPEVPTWDYVATHVRGRLEVIDDDAGQVEILRRTIDRMEADAEHPWTIDDAQEGRVAFLLPLIRSFRIHIDSIEGSTKLSQRHPAGDRERVVAALRARREPSLADYIAADLAGAL